MRVPLPLHSALTYCRCRFPREYALGNKIDHPGTVYVREDDGCTALPIQSGRAALGRRQEPATTASVNRYARLGSIDRRGVSLRHPKPLAISHPLAPVHALAQPPADT